jgi:lipopolysaccharide/colanic/teichoic acid biosynthesis glycosyltransferase
MIEAFSTKRYDAQKRVLDVVLALALLVLSLPIQVLIAIAIAIRLGRPVFFRQPRPGLNGVVFTLVKFRTMEVAGGSFLPTSDEARLTKFGCFLRATSLDELPTLLNVIKGDMSMVGPRPLLVSYLPRYSAHQARRHEVRPGVTGLAQVNGRNAITWEQKFQLDVEYVDNRTLRFDLRILLETVVRVLRRDGISADGQATTTEFRGSPENVENP